MPQQGNTRLTFHDPAMAAATVTETAVLRRRLDELERIVADQGEEIRKLRLHVQALRGGARLAADP